jgi:hypothetical protein
VHPDHRGKGLATTLTQHIVQLAKSIPVKSIRYTTSVGNETSLHLAEAVGMKRKIDLAVHWQENLAEISWRLTGPPLLEVSADAVYQDLIDAKLIPFNILIHDWKAFDVTLNGLNKIGSAARFWIQKRAGKVTSFSLGFTRDASSGLQWSFTIYASDATEFLDHLSHHVEMAFQSGCASIFVAFETEYVETLHNLEWVRLDENEDEEWALTLLERVL